MQKWIRSGKGETQAKQKYGMMYVVCAPMKVVANWASNLLCKE